MSEDEKDTVVNKIKNFDVEFSNEYNIGLDYNANLHQNGKDEIIKVKEFYDSRL